MSDKNIKFDLMLALVYIKSNYKDLIIKNNIIFIK